MLNLYPIIFSLFKLFVYIFFSSFLFDFSIIENIRYFQILLILFLSFLIFIGLSFISAAFSLAFYRGAWIYNIHNTLTILFGGVLYPASFINEAFTFFKYILPLSSIIESFRYSIGAITLDNYEANQNLIILSAHSILFFYGYIIFIYFI